MYECIIDEDKIKKSAKESFNALVVAMNEAGVDLSELAAAFRYQDIEELENYVEIQPTSKFYTEEHSDEMVTASVKNVEEAYNTLVDDFYNRTGVLIELGQADSDSNIDVDYFWAVGIKFSRVLEDLGAKIISWSEWG